MIDERHQYENTDRDDAEMEIIREFGSIKNFREYQEQLSYESELQAHIAGI